MIAKLTRCFEGWRRRCRRTVEIQTVDAIRLYGERARGSRIAPAGRYLHTVNGTPRGSRLLAVLWWIMKAFAEGRNKNRQRRGGRRAMRYSCGVVTPAARSRCAKQNQLVNTLRRRLHGKHRKDAEAPRRQTTSCRCCADDLKRRSLGSPDNFRKVGNAAT